MDIPRLTNAATASDVVEGLRSAGCAIIERLVAPSVMDRVRNELQPFLDATPFGPDEFAGRCTRRTGALIARSVTSRDLIMHPLVLGSVGALLQHATSYQLHLTQLIAIGPGSPAQQIHRDQWAFDFFPFPVGYDVQCNTIWALHDFTESNGATRVIPGSHLREDRLQFKAADTVPAEMPAGSVLFYTGALYHGGGANRSQEIRHGLNVTYAVSWLRQEENQYLSVPAELARTLPESLLRVMGYARGAYALGYVDDMRDPLDVLLQRDEHSTFGDLSAAATRVTE